MPVCPGARLRLGYVYALAEPLYKTLNLKLRLTLHAKRGIFAQLTYASQIICRNCEESW